MYKHAAEAFVPIQDAGGVGEEIRARSRDYCQHISATGADMLLDFGDGRVTLRPTCEGLQLRIEARDLVTFYAIRTLLQGSLFAIVADGQSVEWRPTNETSLGAF